MKSTDRIIRDIRFYETKPKNFVGNYNGIIGNVYKITEETNAIGQRIARKLNQFEFIAGEFDHIYINFIQQIEKDRVIESYKTFDKRIKYFDYEIEPTKFNLLAESEKNKLVKEITFSILKLVCENNIEKSEKLNRVENLINAYETEIEIVFKIKETKSYKIEVSYSIKPKGNMSKIIVKYLNKKENTQYFTTKNLFYYEDIFYLVDKIEFKNNKIVFNPKQSDLGKLATKNYLTPTEIVINEMEKYNSH